MAFAEEWLNCAARSPVYHNAIEIRIIDMQECPKPVDRRRRGRALIRAQPTSGGYRVKNRRNGIRPISLRCFRRPSLTPKMPLFETQLPRGLRHAARGMRRRRLWRHRRPPLVMAGGLCVADLMKCCGAARCPAAYLGRSAAGPTRSGSARCTPSSVTVSTKGVFSAACNGG